LLSARITYNAGSRQERNLKLVAPHELSSKFLLRLRGEDCPAALASLDQQAFLRQVFGAIRSTTFAAQSFSSDRFAGRRSLHWTRNETQTITAGDRTTRYIGVAELIERASASHS
jgi:hypothetical protein